MLRRLLLSVGQVSSVSLLNAAVALLVGVVTARLLGPAGSGEINFLLTVSAVVLLVVGMSTGVALRLTEAGVPSARLLGAYNSLSALQSLITGLVVAVVVLVVGFDNPWLVVGAGVIAAGMCAARQVQESLKACGYVLSSVLGVGIGHTGRLGTTLVAAAATTFTLPLAVVAAALGQISQVVAGWFKLGRVEGGTSFAVDREHWSSLLRSGLRSQGFIVGGVAIERSSRLLVLPLVGSHEAGIFVAAGTLTESLRMFAISAGQILFVRISGDGSSRETDLLKWVVVACQTAGAVMLWFLSPWVVHLLYGVEFAGAVGLLRGLLVAEVLMGLATMDGRALLGAADLRFLSRSTLLVAIAVVLVQVGMIYWLGVLGAVWATVFSYGLWAVVLRWRSCQVARVTP